jgi:hypothetical protein
MKAFVDRYFVCEFYTFQLDLTGNSCEKYNYRSLAGIEPAALRFRCSALRDAGTTGASAPLAFCIFNFVGTVRVQTMGVTGAQNFYN